MIESTKKMRLLSLALVGALTLAMAPAVISDAQAGEQKPATTMKTTGAQDGGTSRASDTSGWETVHRGKIKKVQVTTTDGDGNTHTGCHDHENQVSTPGPC